jgi:DNA invertase Pin-like site-specific DNA recombinase
MRLREFRSNVRPFEPIEFIPFDSTGKLLFNIIGSFAEFERDIIRERVIAGKRKSTRKQGRKPLHINKHEVERLNNEGLNLHQISREIGCSHVTIHKILQKNALINTPIKMIPLFINKRTLINY